MILKGRTFAVVGEGETVEVEANQSGSLYCILVAEIDLTKESTKSNFEQVSFKILSSTSSYQNLTKQDINSGNVSDTLYQYEMARFKVNSSGIVDFQDRRTFIDVDNIYKATKTEYRATLEQLKQELANAKDDSVYMLKDNVAVITGEMQLNASPSTNFIDFVYTRKLIDLPAGFTADNTIIVSFGYRELENEGYMHDMRMAKCQIGGISGSTLGSKILAYIANDSTLTKTEFYKIVLMKV